MEVLTKKGFTLRKKELLRRIQQGSVFIYPTDTIYGIGCNALNEESVQKIRKIKDRFDKPFSIIAPSKEWIKEKCMCNDELDKLPGPYTLIMKLIEKNTVSKSVNYKNGSLGVRIPKHWFSDVIEELGIPIVTTSVNKAGQSFMTDISNLDKDIEKSVEFCIFEGEIEARPSKIINLIDGEVKER